jgi:GcrA cell cycle regulator
MKMTKKGKSIIELKANECRWPIGDPRQEDFHFCGASQTPGRPYCAHHWSTSYDSSRSRHQAGAPAPFVRRAA